MKVRRLMRSAPLTSPLPPNKQSLLPLSMSQCALTHTCAHTRRAHEAFCCSCEFGGRPTPTSRQCPHPPTCAPLAPPPQTGAWHVRAAAFPPDPEGKLEMRLPRVLYCLINIGQVLFALYKLNAMGLLPTQPSDWLSTIPAPGALQHSFGALQ